MRCYCCNRNLSDYESALRHPDTNEYLDICLKCLEDIPITPIAPKDKEVATGYDDEIEDFVADFDLDGESYDDGHS